MESYEYNHYIVILNYIVGVPTKSQINSYCDIPTYLSNSFDLLLFLRVLLIHTVPLKQHPLSTYYANFYGLYYHER